MEWGLLPLASGGVLADHQAMSDLLLRRRFEEWKVGAPWADWNRRRRLGVGLLFGLAVLVGGVAFAGAFWTSWCGISGGQCAPEEDRAIRVLSMVFWASYLAAVAGCALMFLLRRRVFWAVATVVGLIGFLDVWL